MKTILTLFVLFIAGVLAAQAPFLQYNISALAQYEPINTGASATYLKYTGYSVIQPNGSINGAASLTFNRDGSVLTTIKSPSSTYLLFSPIVSSAIAAEQKEFSSSAIGVNVPFDYSHISGTQTLWITSQSESAIALNYLYATGVTTTSVLADVLNNGVHSTPSTTYLNAGGLLQQNKEASASALSGQSIKLDWAAAQPFRIPCQTSMLTLNHDNAYTFTQVVDVNSSPGWTIAESKDRMKLIENSDGTVRYYKYFDKELTFSNNNIQTVATTIVSGSIDPHRPTSDANGVSIANWAIYKETFADASNRIWASLNNSISSSGVTMTLMGNSNAEGKGAASYNIIANGNRFTMGISNTATAYIGFSKPENQVLELNAATINAYGTLWSATGFNTSGNISASSVTGLINFNPSENNIAYLGSSNRITGVTIDNYTTGMNGMSMLSLKQGMFMNSIGTNSSGTLFFQANNSSGIDMNVNKRMTLRIIESGVLVGEFEQVMAAHPRPSVAFGIYSSKGVFQYPSLTTEKIRNLRDVPPGSEVYDTDRDIYLRMYTTGWREVVTLPVEGY